MLNGFRRRISYANVMSTIAVFAVLAGGGAYAASRIGPNDIKRNAVRSKHIKNGQVKPADLRPVRVRQLNLINGWEAVPATGGALRAIKDGFGFVHLEGAIRDGTDDEAFVLPPRFRPSHEVFELVHGPVSGDVTVGRVRIVEDGTATVLGSAAFLGLEGVTFRAAG